MASLPISQQGTFELRDGRIQGTGNGLAIDTVFYNALESLAL